MPKTSIIMFPAPMKTEVRSRFADEGTSCLPPKHEKSGVPLATHSGPRLRMSKPTRQQFFKTGSRKRVVESVLISAKNHSDDVQEQVEFLCDVCKYLQEESEKLIKKLDS